MESDDLSIAAAPPFAGSHTHDDDILRKHTALTKWVVQHGGYLHPHVKIAYDVERQYHLVVENGMNIPAQTRVASVPMPCTLSVLNAIDVEPFTCRGTLFPPQWVKKHSNKPDVLQTFYLMEQYLLGEKSWWAPYIVTLPTIQDVKDLQFDRSEDAMWIEGTNLKAALYAQTSRWQTQYATAMQELRILRWDNATNGAYTWYKEYYH